MLGEITNPWWAFVLLGIIAGIASGLLGIGGGVIMVPALVILLAAFDQKTAQGTALAVMVPLAIVGTLRYMQNPDVTINWTVVALIVAGAIAGSLMGTTLVRHLPLGFIRKCFVVLLIAVAFKMFISKPQPPAIETADEQTQTTQTTED
ncbi:MAG: sulfite exporter TauE/SafE family protein [Planctomycetes bacterium]|nr:sulfite exporter TauE/SafE family protein [Planctomycetota bacterium]